MGQRATEMADGSGAAVVAGFGLVLTAFALSTDYRLRAGASASISELCLYIAIGGMLMGRSRAASAVDRSGLWFSFGLLVILLGARAYYFNLVWVPDVESPFSHIRDVTAPLLFVLIALSRFRLGRRGEACVLTAFLVGATCSAGLGICQFVRGGPYLAEAVDILSYKTAVAHTYWLARVLDLDVKNLARGLYSFPINYAAALVVPSLLAFALACAGPWWRRLAGLCAFAMMYTAIVLSFSRSVIAIVPFGCLLTALAVRGRLRPVVCVATVAGYLFLAFVLPMIQFQSVADSEMNTLNARLESMRTYFRCLGRDPEMLWLGTPLVYWREFGGISPHNWVINSLKSDGLLPTLLRIGIYFALLVRLFPVRRGQRTDPLRAGLWCGAFVLLAVVGETEPFTGIAEYLDGAFGLGLCAVLPERRVVALRLEPLQPPKSAESRPESVAPSAASA